MSVKGLEYNNVHERVDVGRSYGERGGHARTRNTITSTNAWALVEGMGSEAGVQESI